MTRDWDEFTAGSILKVVALNRDTRTLLSRDSARRVC